MYVPGTCRLSSLPFDNSPVVLVFEHDFNADEFEVANLSVEVTPPNTAGIHRNYVNHITPLSKILQRMKQNSELIRKLHINNELIL